MTEINLDQWERKEHYRFFMNTDIPFFNVNFNIDITGFRDHAKALGVSVSNALMHRVTAALNGIDSFLYRMQDGRLVRYDRLNPSFTSMREGEELFRLITVEFEHDLAAFDRAVREKIAGSTAFFDLSMLQGRSDFVFISALPWIPFTGLDHTVSFRREDAIPRVSWGKFFLSEGRELVPFNIRVNHGFVDGYHVGLFYQRLQADIARG